MLVKKIYCAGKIEKQDWRHEIFNIRGNTIVLRYHIDENGKLNNSQGSALAEGDIILQGSKKQDAAWQFLKWWTSDEIQTQFGNEIESLMGPTARWNTANLNAFKNLPWNKSDYTVIQKSLNNIDEVPVVLGGYYSSRYMTNAFNSVVVSNMNPRDSLEQAVTNINKELLRRREGIGK